MTVFHLPAPPAIPVACHVGVTAILVVALWWLAHGFAYRYKGVGGKRTAALFGVTAVLAMAKMAARIEGFWIDPLWLALKLSIAVSLWSVIFLPSCSGKGDDAS